MGSHDPVRRGTVVAIFDMGPHEPFVVWCETSCLSLVWAVLDLFFSHASNGAAFTEIDRQREGPDRRVS